jgi:hypothetical protein
VRSPVVFGVVELQKEWLRFSATEATPTIDGQELGPQRGSILSRPTRVVPIHVFRVGSPVLTLAISVKLSGRGVGSSAPRVDRGSVALFVAMLRRT